MAPSRAVNPRALRWGCISVWMVFRCETLSQKERWPLRIDGAHLLTMAVLETCRNDIPAPQRIPRPNPTSVVNAPEVKSCGLAQDHVLQVR